MWIRVVLVMVTFYARYLLIILPSCRNAFHASGWVNHLTLFSIWSVHIILICLSQPKFIRSDLTMDVITCPHPAVLPHVWLSNPSTSVGRAGSEHEPPGTYLSNQRYTRYMKSPSGPFLKRTESPCIQVCPTSSVPRTHRIYI